MDRTEAATLARTIMNEHGLTDWTFQFDRARRRFGRCSHHRRTVSLSGPLTELNDVAEVRDTILHEVAHALVGPGHGHDGVWKRKAREVGADPSRCYDGENVKQPPRRWIGTCPNPDCDLEVRRHRLAQSARRASCPRCSGESWNEDFIIEWKRNPAATAAA